MGLRLEDIPKDLFEFSHFRLGADSTADRIQLQLACNATGRIFGEQFIDTPKHEQVVMKTGWACYNGRPRLVASKAGYRIMNVYADTCTNIEMPPCHV